MLRLHSGLWLTFGLLAQPVAGQDIATAGLGHDLGEPDARVLVVELLDFGCSACAQFTRETMPRLMKEYVETGLVRWRALPFSAGFANGKEAARASECAADQGSFWAMHDLLYERQKEWERERDPRARYEAYAAEVGLDPIGFTACYRLANVDERRERNDRVAREVGVPGTPAFVIGEQRIVGAVPYELFKQYLDRAIAAAGGGRRSPR